MWKTAIVFIVLSAAQNLCAAETGGSYTTVFGGVLLTIAAAVGLGSMRGAGEASFRTSPGLAPAQAVDACKDGRSGGPGSAYLEANGSQALVLDFPKMRVEYMTGETPAFVREIPAESAFTAARKPLPIMFFGENWGDPLCLNNHNNRTVSMKLYGVRAYEHGRLVRDYRPALRDGVPCLHDEVTGAFCTDPRDQAPFLAYCGQIPLDKIFGLMMVFK